MQYRKMFVSTVGLRRRLTLRRRVSDGADPPGAVLDDQSLDGLRARVRVAGTHYCVVDAQARAAGGRVAHSARRINGHVICMSKQSDLGVRVTRDTNAG